MRAQNPQLLSETVLYILYQEAISTGGKLNHPTILSRFPSDCVTSTLITFALDETMDRKFVERELDNRTANYIYVISRQGYDYVRYRMSLAGSAINSVSISMDWILEEEQTGDDAPSVDREANTSGNEEGDWEPLPLERSGSGYEDAVAKTEAAYAEILGNNGYADSEPEEREYVAWTLSEGIKHIKDGLPNRDQVVSMLIRPLSYLGEKFAGASIGEAAKVAAKALWTWITGA